MHSQLMEVIIKKEQEIRHEFNLDNSSSESFLYAILSYFNQPYSGFTLNDHLIPFEEERVRLILGRVLKSSINLSKHVLKTSLKNIESFNDWKSIQTCDYLLLQCILCLNEKSLKIIHKEYHQYKISDLLIEIDKEIYPYVIEQLNDVKNKINEKIDKAIEYRDYLPKEKYMDESEILKILKDNIKIGLNNNLMTLNISSFFKDSKDKLVLSIIKKDDMYYIHDHGCTIKEINKRITSKSECIELTKQFLSGTICYLKGDVVIGEINSLPYFSIYLQYLIMIANLDLIHGLFEVKEDYFREEVYPFEGKDDLNEMINYIQNYFNVHYDEQKGILISSHLCYFGNNTTASFQIEIESGKVIIKDYYNSYQEGAIFENVWYNEEDLSSYKTYINMIVRRFGGKFDGIRVYYSFERNDSFIQSLLAYIQMSVLLAPMNELFNLEKIKTL